MLRVSIRFLPGPWTMVRPFALATIIACTHQPCNALPKFTSWSEKYPCTVVMVIMLPIRLPSFLFTIVTAIIFFNVLLEKQFVLNDLAWFILRTDKYLIACRLNISVEWDLSYGLIWPNEEVPGPGCRAICSWWTPSSLVHLAQLWGKNTQCWGKFENKIKRKVWLLAGWKEERAC